MFFDVTNFFIILLLVEFLKWKGWAESYIDYKAAFKKLQVLLKPDGSLFSWIKTLLTVVPTSSAVTSFNIRVYFSTASVTNSQDFKINGNECSGSFNVHAFM